MMQDFEDEHLEAGPKCEMKTVMMTPELMNEMATRTLSGYRVSWEWKLENYFTGIWTPIATVHHDDKLYTLEEARLVLDK